MIAPYPFLQALTERDRRWPRLALMIAAAPAAVLVLAMVVAIVLGALSGGELFAVNDLPKLRRSAVYVLQIGVGLGALSLAVLLVARISFARPLSTWLTAAPHFRWGLVAWGASITAVGVAVLMIVDAMIHPGGDAAPPILDPASDLPLKLFYLAAVLIGLFVAATAEEVVFRGYLLQQTAAFTRNVWLIVGLNAAVFALAHLEFDPAALAARVLAGAAFAWAALRLGGLEFAIGAHVATNLMIALFQAPMLPEDAQVAKVTGGLDDTAGEVLLALYTVWVVELTRRMPRLTGSTSSPA